MYPFGVMEEDEILISVRTVTQQNVRNFRSWIGEVTFKIYVVRSGTTNTRFCRSVYNLCHQSILILTFVNFDSEIFLCWYRHVVSSLRVRLLAVWLATPLLLHATRVVS